MSTQLRTLADRHTAEMIAFCQQIVRTPSPPGEEGAVAELVRAEMTRLGYDDVWIDRWGNVVGLLRGAGSGASVMFNGHMDHVDPGNPDDWPHPPFGGEIHDGKLWGRGSADMKGPVAAMIHAVGALAREGIRPAGDIYVAAVVQEEIGGLGTAKLVEALKIDCAVNGEASRNQLTRGHRGRVGLVMQVRGRSVHASIPHKGVNPHGVIARFVQGLEALEMADGGEFGRSTVVPTLIQTDQRSANVIPGEIVLHLDWRNVPGETTDAILAQLRPLLDAALAQVPGSSGSVSVYEQPFHTWTGQTLAFPSVFPSFGLAADDPLVLAGRQILQQTLVRELAVIIWPFATDGGHLMAAGVPTIGFGPGEAETLHTVGEHIALDMLAESMLGYMALALRLGETMLSA